MTGLSPDTWSIIDWMRSRSETWTPAYLDACNRMGACKTAQWTADDVVTAWEKSFPKPAEVPSVPESEEG